MVMSWTRTLLQGFLWPWTMVAVTWLTAMSVRGQLQSGRAPATRREGKLGRTRRRRWRGVTSGVANTCAEDEKQPWVNGEKKFVYHGARWLGSHARRWRCEKWSGRGYAVQNRGKRSRKPKLFRRRPCGRVAARLTNANITHTSLGLLGRQWTWRSTSAQSWTSYTAVLNILSGFWQKLVVSSSAKRSITCYGSYERPCLRGYPWLLLFKGEQCCASPQETNGLKDMDGLLTAALFLSLTSMLSNRA